MTSADEGLAGGVLGQGDHHGSPQIKDGVRDSTSLLQDGGKGIEG